MKNRVFIAEFNAEEKLKSGKEFSLPAFSFPNKIASSLLDGMDGLLLTMLDRNDYLITKYRLSDTYVDYWNENLFEFTNIGLLEDASTDDRNVYQLISDEYDIQQILRNKQIVEYAKIPDFYSMCNKLDMSEEGVSIEAVCKINKKSYSNNLKKKYGLKGLGIQVTSIEQFQSEAVGLLAKEEKILIKDSLGVSGKGLQVIEHVGQIERLVKHFEKQKNSGKKIFDFILEPFMNKKIDFSCQMFIDKNGKMSIQGYQKNNNKGFAYKESVELDEDEMQLINSSGYVQTIQKVSKEIYNDGYYGYVCIDSMILENEEIVEIVEINPRMSMARFNLNMQKNLGKHCCLTYSDVIFKSNYYIDDFIKSLRKHNILYLKGSTGVIPLAPGTWSVHRFGDNSNIKLRVYFIIVYQSSEELDCIRKKINEILIV